MTDFQRIDLLTEGLGECTSCGRGFAWSMNLASKETRITLAARANQLFRT